MDTRGAVMLKKRPIRRGLWGLLIIVAGLAGCPSPQRGMFTTVAPTLATEDGFLVHRAAGALFPARIGAFERGESKSFDPAGTNVAVAYHLRRMAEATLYVYPVTTHGPDGPDGFNQEFEMVKAAVRQLHSAALLLDEGFAETRHNDLVTRGRVARYSIPVSSAGGQPGVRSLAYLFRQGPWFVKYRVTYLEARRHEVEGDVATLVESLAWRPHRPTLDRIVLDRALTGRPREVTSAWMAYAGRRALWINEYFAKTPAPIHYEPSFEEEVAARTLLVRTWREVKAQAAVADTYLDALLRVHDAGFLPEYTWAVLRVPQWRELPAGLRLTEFENWRAQHLRDHRPETRATLMLK